jgi:hypothetical protein
MSMLKGITIAAAITARKNIGRFVSNTELTTVVALTIDALLVAGTAEIFEIFGTTLAEVFALSSGIVPLFGVT